MKFVFSIPLYMRDEFSSYVGKKERHKGLLNNRRNIIFRIRLWVPIVCLQSICLHTKRYVINNFNPG